MSQLLPMVMDAHNLHDNGKNFSGCFCLEKLLIQSRWISLKKSDDLMRQRPEMTWDANWEFMGKLAFFANIQPHSGMIWIRFTKMPTISNWSNWKKWNETGFFTHRANRTKDHYFRWHLMLLKGIRSAFFIRQSKSGLCYYNDL